MHFHTKTFLVKSDKETSQIQMEGTSDSVLDMATHYHKEASIHHQKGDHEKAAYNIMMALNYYRKVD